MKRPNLPFLTFILSDHSTHALACDVAKALGAYDDTAVVWDFEAPIHEALEPLIEVDFGHDMGDPRTNEPSTNDRIKSLAKWIDENLGEDFITMRAFEEVKAQAEFRDEPIIFRDGSWKRLAPFLLQFNPHEVLIVDLVCGVNLPVGAAYKEFTNRHLTCPHDSVDAIVEAVKDACK